MARTSNYEYEWSYFGASKAEATRTYNGSGDATIDFGYSDYYGRTARSTRISYDADIFQGSATVTQPAKNPYATASANGCGTVASPLKIPAAGAWGYMLLETNKDFTSTPLKYSYSLTYGSTIQISSASCLSYSDALLQNLTTASGVADTSITLSKCSADYGADQRFTIKADTHFSCPAYLKSGIQHNIDLNQGATQVGTLSTVFTAETKTLLGSAGTIATEATTGSFTVTSNCIRTSLAYEGRPADSSNGNLPDWSITLSKTLLNDESDRFSTAAQTVDVTTDYYWGNMDRGIYIDATIPEHAATRLGTLITQKAKSPYVEFDSIRIGSKTAASIVEGGEYAGDSYFNIYASFLTNQDPTGNTYWKLRGTVSSYFEYDTASAVNKFEIATGSGTYLHGDSTTITTDSAYCSASTKAADKNYGANTYYRVWVPLRVKTTDSSYNRIDFEMLYGENSIKSTYCYFKTASAFNLFAPTITTTGGQADVTVTTNVDDWTATLDQEN